MSRLLSNLVVLSALSLPIAAQAQQLPGASAKQVIIPAGQNPSSMLSAGIRVGDMVYASGQLGLNRQAPDSTIEGQTRLALENTRSVLEAAGTNMANVVKCTVFLTRAADFQGMNRVYREFFPSAPPARSTVVVAALVVPAAIVEIECMAVMPK